MDIGITTGKDIAEFVSYIITSLSLIGLLITYVISKKQIHFSAMEKCINYFRNIISLREVETQEDLVWKYIDLVNEEFFYLEKNYLPIEVSIEWVDGMIDYLPFYDNNGNLISSGNFSLLDDPSFVKIVTNDYPRVLKAIHLKKEINFESVRVSPLNEDDRKLRFEERNKLIFLIITNLKISIWKKLFLKKKIARR